MILLIILVSLQKRSSINFTKSKIRSCLGLQDNGADSYSHVNKTKICKIKDLGFFLKSASKSFPKENMKRIALSDNWQSFSAVHG